MSKNKKTLLFKTLLGILVFTFSFSLLLAPLAVYGQEQHDWNSWEIIPSECSGSGGNCNLNSFIKLFVNLSYIMLKVLPYLAMLMMIAGGFMLLIAGGKQERLQTGKRVITSVILGTVIVIGLAWALSFFVVATLTGDTEQESGKIFGGYKGIWEKEWWGGGEAIKYPPGTGCCVVEDYGCIDGASEDNCNEYKVSHGVNTFFQGKNRACSEFPATCEEFTIGCCVSDDEDNKTCYWPNSQSGCVLYPTTYHSTTACSYLADDCDPGNIQGEDDSPETWGCCVGIGTCQHTTISNCFGGDFQPLIDCSELAECSIGCCVGKTACSVGQINCSGEWNQYPCNNASLPVAMPNTQACEIGCCIEDPTGNHNCWENTTHGWCDRFSLMNFQTATSCSSIGSCTDGCCQETCQSGNIDGSCAEYNYDVANDCSNNLSCRGVCCLYENTTQCVDDVPASNCLPPHQDYTGLPNNPCSGFTQCDLGCCIDRNPGTYSCIEPYARAACSYPGETYINNCAADNDCDRGCCVDANDLCHDNYNRMWCDSVSGSLSVGTACNTIGQCNGCCIEDANNKSACHDSWSEGQCNQVNGLQFNAGENCTEYIIASGPGCDIGCCVVETSSVPLVYTCYSGGTRAYCSLLSSSSSFEINDQNCNNWESYGCYLVE